MKKVKIGNRHHFVNVFAADEIERQRVEIEQYRIVLQDIADQSKSDELGVDAENADFEGAYDIMVQLSRSVLNGDSRDG